MRHTMMDFPLTLDVLFRRAGALYADAEIVSRLPDKSLHRHTYADFDRRTRKLASALAALGLRKGDRVATLAWNHYAHLEAYFGIPIAGGVLHTLNLRLHPDDISYIAAHAGDRFVIVDDVLLPLFEKCQHAAKFEKVIVVPLTGQPVPAGRIDYEKMLAEADEKAPLPVLAESDPMGMCYTSGTTGKPKGVVYSHRAMCLHSLAAGLVDTLGVSRNDTVVAVVPMFHANAWGLPYVCEMVGAKQVYPGPHLDPASLLDLFEKEAVTLAAGVPTIWMGILEQLEKNPGRWKLQPGLRMVVGGSAAPEAMIRTMDKHGLRVVHAWGMTETTPLGSVSHPPPQLTDEDEIYAVRAKQGIPSPFVELRAVGDSDEVPRDGKTPGELQVRGCWVAREYHELPEETEARWTKDGWFKTGDVVTIDPHGYIKITDRTKDLIKSGGEWISSVELENLLMGHPAVKEAAVVAVPHPKWAERPLAVVVKKDGATVTDDELRTYLAAKVAKWAVPDAYAYVDAIPRTSAGKFLKSELRERFKDWKW
ncbi:MAG TPA: long-chain fatty acid--CoA ligase [Polyangiaceae bacterium]|nr:long-chain fatty acid--CoA ligase [Polyangiaceae bacterium]